MNDADFDNFSAADLIIGAIPQLGVIEGALKQYLETQAWQIQGIQDAMTALDRARTDNLDRMTDEN